MNCLDTYSYSQCWRQLLRRSGAPQQRGESSTAKHPGQGARELNPSSPIPHGTHLPSKASDGASTAARVGSLPGSRGILEVELTWASNPCALQRQLPLQALLNPKSSFNLVLPSRHFHWRKSHLPSALSPASSPLQATDPGLLRR